MDIYHFICGIECESNHDNNYVIIRRKKLSLIYFVHRAIILNSLREQREQKREAGRSG